jgi:hypothetical protein
MPNKSMLAAVATTAALSVGLALPATGGAAKARSKSARASADLSQLCTALGLKPLLDNLDVNLSPLVRVRLSKVCGS